MDFNLKSPLVTRVAILTGSIFVWCIIITRDSPSWVMVFFVGCIVLFQVRELIRAVERSNADLSNFLDSIRFDDLSSSFKTDSQDPTVVRLHQELNEAIQKLRISRKEKDSEYQFFKNIVQHVGIGILTFKRDGSIQIINTAAKRLLKVTRAETIEDIREVDDALVDSFLKLKTGGRELIRLKTGDETLQLSIFAIELTLRDEEVKLISMSNIQSELDEKEMEAWQNLVRVLTHEIMNSVTPISSLAGIVEEELGKKIQYEQDIKNEELGDMHLSLQTISRRSAGLIRFVKEFRNLTHIPKPKLAEIPVKPLLEEMAMLHKKELSDHGVTITCSVEPDNLFILADKTMIEQVLINLIKNAIQAFTETEIVGRKIELIARSNEKGRAVISVKDNGTGIDAEALEKIFIPFFSTKKTGSGIGLSLSKQIMLQHEGRITVKSKLGEGTEFVLRF